MNGKCSETSDKAFKAIVTIQPLSDLLYEILKQAVPVDGGSSISANGGSSRIPASVALAAGESGHLPFSLFSFHSTSWANVSKAKVVTHASILPLSPSGMLCFPPVVESYTETVLLSSNSSSCIRTHRRQCPKCS